MLQVLLGVQSLLGEPNPDDPAQREPFALFKCVALGLWGSTRDVADASRALLWLLVLNVCARCVCARGRRENRAAYERRVREEAAKYAAGSGDAADA